MVMAAQKHAVAFIMDHVIHSQANAIVAQDGLVQIVRRNAISGGSDRIVLLNAFVKSQTHTHAIQ